MELVVLTGITLFGITYLNQEAPRTQTPNPKPVVGVLSEVTTYRQPEPFYNDNIFNMNEMGLPYSMAKASFLNLTDLNDASKPWSAPDASAGNLYDLFDSQAKTQAYLQSTALPFYFNKTGEVPLDSAQNANYLVEIPSRASITGDPGASLASYGRVYINSFLESNVPTSEVDDGLLNAFEPTEWQRVQIQTNNDIPAFSNPWGPGGQLQKIFNEEGMRRTLERGADQASVLSKNF